jgi:hypothetical protein
MILARRETKAPLIILTVPPRHDHGYVKECIPSKVSVEL